MLALLVVAAACAEVPTAALAQVVIDPGDRPQLPAASPYSGTATRVHLAVGPPASASPGENDGAAAAAASGQPPAASIVYRFATVLPTYPADAYQTSQVDEAYNWPYMRFDREQFLEDDPQAVNRAYRLIALENDLLRVLILPDLGGRIWQVIHKPTGHTMFYQNTVVKSSPWGPANQIGWTGLGGLEWNLPVVEHGYDWGTPWDVEAFVDADGSAVARISTPADGRVPSATVTVKLPPGAAYIEIEPHIENTGDAPLSFDYWHSAMLAPGPFNQPSKELRFIIPGDYVRIHSTGDERLPGAGNLMPWPYVGPRDLSRLGDWDQYLGFFEYPAAHGPFAAVYDAVGDAGAVRVYPANVAEGSKVFGLGWHDALASEYYTDDGSAYVELHGGLAPTYSDHAFLDAGAAVQWSERWFPVYGIGQFAVADAAGALSWRIDQGSLTVGFYPSQPFSGRLVVTTPDGREVARQVLEAAAGIPVNLAVDLTAADGGALVLSLEDALGATALTATVDVP